MNSLHIKNRLARFAALLTALLMTMLAVTPGHFARAERDEFDPVVIGRDLSHFASEDIFANAVDGSVFSQRQLTVLHYFATWSPDCIREMSYMQAALDSFGAGEIAVYGLLFEDASSTPESCAALFEQLSLSYGCLRLDTVLSELVREYPYIPQTFFVDSSGIVTAHMPGTFTNSAQLEAMIEHEIGHPSTFRSVSFIDGHTGELILRLSVPNGADAVPPEPPEHEGYVFIGWEGDYLNVTEDRIVTAVYVRANDYHIQGDVDLNGSVTVADAVLIMRHSMGIFWSDNVVFYGNVNGDDTISIADAMLVLRHALGIFSL